MSADERAIRNAINRWMLSSQMGDLDAVQLDDGRRRLHDARPRALLARQSRDLKGVRVQGESNPVEIKVLGDWAYVRNHLTVKMTPPNGEPGTRAGYTLTIFMRQADGRWLLVRDANLLA